MNMIQRQYKRAQSQKGFTLIEMLIAVFIFTVSISALTYMAGRGIRAANDSKQRIVAEYLALEGMEAVRNIRDTAFLSNSSISTWTGVFGGDISGPGGCFNVDSSQNTPCAFSYNNGVPELQECNSQCSLFLDTITKTYTYASGGQTPYTRKIYLNQISQTEVKVRVLVEWGNESIEYQEHLFLWG